MKTPEQIILNQITKNPNFEGCDLDKLCREIKDYTSLKKKKKILIDRFTGFCLSGVKITPTNVIEYFIKNKLIDFSVIGDHLCTQPEDYYEKVFNIVPQTEEY